MDDPMVLCNERCMTYAFKKIDGKYVCIHQEGFDGSATNPWQDERLYQLFDSLTKDRIKGYKTIDDKLHVVWHIDDSFFGHAYDIGRTELISQWIAKGLKNGEFELYYQPQINTKLNRVIGAEALIRWNHPEFGRMSPMQFIPVAERTGQILELGRWMIEQACSQYRKWRDTGHADIRLSMNMSVKQLEHKSTLTHLWNVITHYGIDPAKVTLEITESHSLKEPENMEKVLRSIKSKGIHLAIDDFGTGYSSLYYLSKFPIDQLKIDRSLTEMLSTEHGHAVVRFIVDMAHNLNYSVIAEGVETKDQMDALQKIDCFEVQGHLFSPALPEQEFLHYINSFK